MAVADEVVLLGGRFGGVGVEEVERVVGGRAEGVVGEGEAAGFLVGFEEREVDDPAEGQDVGVDQAQLVAEGEA